MANRMTIFLFQNGAGVHVRDRNNDTPLMCAIEFGHEEVIEALIECGAHLQVKQQHLKLDKSSFKRPLIIINEVDEDVILTDKMDANTKIYWFNLDTFTVTVYNIKK